MFKINGTLKKIFPTQQVSEKFTKREFVLTESSSMYPQDVLFQLTQDKVGLMDMFQENDMVEVSFNLRGREWVSPQGETKYFNSLDAWRVERVGATQGMPAQPSPMNIPTPTSPMTPDMTAPAEEDDLPF